MVFKTRKQIEKKKQTKGQFFKKKKKIHKPLAMLNMKKIEKIQINKIRSKREVINTDFMDIKIIVK